jgi:hypothetical protein
LRRSFDPLDMRAMQRAADRIGATGDNSAVEAFLASPEALYFYEVVESNGGSKRHFLEQQVALAHTIYPPLARLLQITGEHRAFDARDWEELAPLLQDPNLSDALQKFCRKIVRHHSFLEIVRRALKRAFWHFVHPHLPRVESQLLAGKWQRHPGGHIEDLAQKIRKLCQDVV